MRFCHVFPFPSWTDICHTARPFTPTLTLCLNFESIGHAQTASPPHTPPKLDWELGLAHGCSLQGLLRLSQRSCSAPWWVEPLLSSPGWGGWVHVAVLFHCCLPGNNGLCNLQHVLQPCWAYSSLPNILREQPRQSTKWLPVQIFRCHHMGKPLEFRFYETFLRRNVAFAKPAGFSEAMAWG